VSLPRWINTLPLGESPDESVISTGQVATGRSGWA
jgi:hypothetical protein